MIRLFPMNSCMSIWSRFIPNFYASFEEISNLSNLYRIFSFLIDLSEQSKISSRYIRLSADEPSVFAG